MGRRGVPSVDVVVLAGTVPPSLCSVSEDIGRRVVAALGEPAARKLLEILDRSDADRAALIGRLQLRDDARWLAELLIDLEDDVGEIARLRLAEALRRQVGES